MYHDWFLGESIFKCTMIGFLVKVEMRFLTASRTCGIKTLVAISPVWPPASVPCAHNKSTPTSIAFIACFGCPIIFMTLTLKLNNKLNQNQIWCLILIQICFTGMPAAWNLSTTHFGGTPTALTKRVAFSSIMMLTKSVLYMNTKPFAKQKLT